MPSVQVGQTCYPSVADAAKAACAEFKRDVLTTYDYRLVSTSCAGVDENGLMMIQTIYKDHYYPEDNFTRIETIDSSYMPCLDSDKTNAYLSIFGALLGVIVLAWCLWGFIRFIDHARAEPT